MPTLLSTPPLGGILGIKAKHPQLECESEVYKMPAGGVGVPLVRKAHQIVSTYV